MTCSERVKLNFLEIKLSIARKEKTCVYCKQPIKRTYYVLIRRFNEKLYYHLDCFNKDHHDLKVMITGKGLMFCW